MAIIKMHAEEVDTSAQLVAKLLAEQFPQWAGLPISAVDSAGTDNAIFRLGSDKVVRLPRIHWAVDQVTKEHKWLPRLAAQLPLTIPTPLIKGQPSDGYPWQWSIYQWLQGENAIISRITDLNKAAVDLAVFIAALQKIDTSGAPQAEDQNLRGAPLARRDAATRQAITALQGMFDAQVLTSVWETALHAPAWQHAPVWFHGDLLPGNLLIENGRLSAVIDFAGLGAGDPACDLMIAWSLFSGDSRAAFRAALQVDEATWARGRGHALSQALIFIPYYINSNPLGVSCAKQTVKNILAGFSSGS